MTAFVGGEPAPALPLAHEMLMSSLTRQGFDPRTVAAVAAVPRHPFVPRGLWRLAYADVDLWRFGLGPSPRSAAALLHAAGVRAGETCVELGTGSGWVAAVLTHLAGRVSTVARVAGEAAPALYATTVTVVGCADLTPGGLRPLLRDADVVLATYAPGGVPVPVVRALRPGARLVVAAGPPPQPVTTLVIRREDVEVRHRGEVRLGARADLDAALTAAVGGEDGGRR